MAKYKVLAHGAELRAIVAPRKMAGLTLQMDVTVLSEVTTGMNVH